MPLTHLENFGEVARAAWANRDQARYAWRILSDGVYDDCALGTSGLKDWTVDGVHLCNVRLRLLRLNTMPAADPARFRDVAALRTLSSRELRDLGRLPTPLLRRRGEPGFTPVSWDAAMELMVARLAATEPDRAYLYLTSRGTANETYYAAQKAMRALGTHNVDNAARTCHAPSTVALKAALGVGATTCSYPDLIGTDVVTFVGSNVAKNQPVVMNYLYHAKKAGTTVVTVGPYLEPGMDAYWVPSDVESALFGTTITDRFVQVAAGGDLAFLRGTLKALIARAGVDRAFVDAHTSGFDALAAVLEGTDWADLEAASGVARADMESYADLLAGAERAVFVWGMGVTQAGSGEDAVRALVDLALARGFVGRDGCGLMPIRGHSGVQGGAEMGVDATLGRIPLRVHFDITASSQMLVDPANLVLLLPATTRYEVPGGVTETTTERRIVFSPEVPGPRVADARPEWRVLAELVARARPDRAGALAWDGTAAIRREIARVVPMYAGIERLATKGDQVQYGGPHLCAGGVFPTADGRARFHADGPQVRALDRDLGRDPDAFTVVTRRGKQFNSMVHEDVDPLSGFARDAVLIAHADAERLSLAAGDRVVVENDRGRLLGRAAPVAMSAGAVQVHWPEANVLLGLPDALRAGQTLFDATGGLHAAVDVARRFGVTLAAFVLALTYLAGWHETRAGWLPFVYLSILLLGFFTWQGGLWGIESPNA
ncbi:MAG: molybdopterin-dependent oxidoreductase, partial [Trueperaceae bacterium]|nr:molybdopterin-dependent oxidoreductase [Trueperaceae bacterium]